ncbi:FecCD family ABC transporter permease [Clostridium ganghwense]|uniref:Iron ABC transporter permease n=1 Tax=Clostridium ganghwense TaxID=312089 RepID=A0ABT4CLH8_9CLOT|nr:iron ABC transporter permease [Clostridium ganghwense]MCY6369783.1 iron ABC transporter permease [Clostridium ganghwense]
MKHKKRFFSASVLLILCVFISFSVGRYNISMSTILYLIKAKIMSLQLNADTQTAYVAFWIIRVPRTIMAAMVGAVLGVTGTVFQGVFRNPLVSPDVLGISPAASFGAGIAIIGFGSSIFLIQAIAFAFALFAVLVALGIGTKNHYNSITSLVLAGIVISSLFSAGNSILKYIADPYTQLPAITFWSLGAFNKVTWNNVIQATPIFVICLLVIYMIRWYIDILSLEEEEAISLGINVKKIRIILILFSTCMTASSIAYCGIIGWISLIIPHIARFMVGPENKVLIPFSAIFGALFTLIMDIVARTIFPGEIPISILTSCVGAPFLGYLLIKYNKKKWFG